MSSDGEAIDGDEINAYVLSFDTDSVVQIRLSSEGDNLNTVSYTYAEYLDYVLVDRLYWDWQRRIKTDYRKVIGELLEGKSNDSSAFNA